MNSCKLAGRKAILIGGMGRNVPANLYEFFDVVLHVEASGRVPRFVPHADIIIVFFEYSSQAIERPVQIALPGVPVIKSRATWSHLSTRLLEMDMLPSPKVAPPEPERVEIEDPTPAPEAKMSDAELEKLTAPEPAPAPVVEARVEAPEQGPNLREALAAQLTINVPREYALMLDAARKLEEKRTALKREIEVKERELEKMDLELEAYAPILDAEKMFQKAVTRAKEKIGRVG